MLRKFPVLWKTLEVSIFKCNIGGVACKNSQLVSYGRIFRCSQGGHLDYFISYIWIMSKNKLHNFIIKKYNIYILF